MNLLEQHRDQAAAPKGAFEFHLQRIKAIVDFIATKDETLGGNWYLAGDTQQDALQYEVFANGAASKAAIDVLKAEYGHGKKIDRPKVIGIWNGRQTDGATAIMSLMIDTGVISNNIELSLDEKANGLSRLGNYKSVAEVVAKVAELYRSLYVTFGPRAYQDQQVFDARLGVSWMLYLPHALAPAQVPEARDLIPVMRDGKQQGTIIVSVTDEVFDVNNLEHVKAANDIEIRLADQDLLPRFVDL
ncbi:hypothetical protein OKW38_006218 [Paraburkholderia sp. MM5496-R1]|uniref:immunity 52 family protein n=1 Tax=Paraburkholderia sp. MM5496-R1 TaxID=2991065 RepID=UPI003D1C24A8